MKHKFTHSNNVAEAEHTADGLTVKYKSGDTYFYPGVPESHFHGMRAAQSPGSYLRANVVNPVDEQGRKLYPHTKL